MRDIEKKLSDLELEPVYVFLLKKQKHDVFLIFKYASFLFWLAGNHMLKK